MSSTTTLTVVLALLAAGAYGVASALQSHEARATQASMSGLTAVLARPLWWGGLLADIAGLGLHVAALSMGPATVVQPVQVTGLLVALPLGRRLRRERQPRTEVVPAIGTVAGVGVFLLATRPSAATAGLSTPGGLAIAVGGLTLIVASLAWVRRRPGTSSSVGLAAAAGVGFAVTAVLLDGLSSLVGRHGWRVLGTGHAAVLLAAVVVVGAAATVASQAAFQSGSLAVTLPVLTILDPFAAVLLGGLVLGETPRLTEGRIAADVVAAALVTGSVAWLVRLTGSSTPPAVITTRTRTPRTVLRRALLTSRSRALVAGAGIGCLYGLTLAPILVLAETKVDSDDPALTRGALLLLCCASVALVNTLRVARSPAVGRR